MPSVSVPLKGGKGWDELMARRKAFWRKDGNNTLHQELQSRPSSTPTTAAPAPPTPGPRWSNSAAQYLEPMRTKFGTCYVLSGYRHEAYNRAIGGARHSQHIYEQSFESRGRRHAVRQRHPGPMGGRSQTASGRRPEGKAASAATTAPASSTSTTAATKPTGRASRSSRQPAYGYWRHPRSS